MIEAEVKLAVQEPDEMRRKLAEAGFEKEQLLFIKDTYFDDPNGKIREEGLALRVRENRDLDTNEEKSQITFKGKRIDSETKTRSEFESGVENAETCRSIFEGLGYVRVSPEVSKERLELKRGEMNACLDNVEGLGWFLELEVVAREDEYKQAIEKLYAAMDEFGYGKEDIIKNSYLTLLQKKEEK